MVAVRIYIEGGGDSSSQKAEFRQGLASFWEKAGFKSKMPRTIPCGSRNSAYSDFCTGVKTHPQDVCILLVDSEEAFQDAGGKWQFLNIRDGWDRPLEIGEENVFLMVRTMETWLMADRDALANYYGANFNPRALPPEQNPVESLSKDVMYTALENATKFTKKGAYSKGGHSFKLIGLISPQKVFASSPTAKSLFDRLTEIL